MNELLCALCVLRGEMTFLNTLFTAELAKIAENILYRFILFTFSLGALCVLGGSIGRVSIMHMLINKNRVYHPFASLTREHRKKLCLE
ncbi:hypothetical protein A7E78_00445 [Syntrophotalea acetylenivorans]|uniref:Uncharacterized protein n=1 Tax=Syntrophotalea acetylenivorans TaxID=1842532 RepID=A0A1L3GLD0_9BACT|nr:hypothetical protein A7E78_00445 [Syntrophotalea acetylenivorans]